MAGGDVHRVDTLQRGDADAQRRRSEVVEAAERVLAGQAFLHQALQVAVRGRAAGAGAPGHFAEGQLDLGVGQDVEEARGDGHRLDGAGALFARRVRHLVRRGLRSVQRLGLLTRGFHRLRSALRWRGRRP
ncbi:hypothetical protein D9M69_604420 [compost metagenome]